jgi:hypothetical protein
VLGKVKVDLADLDNKLWNDFSYTSFLEIHVPAETSYEEAI